MPVLTLFVGLKPYTFTNNIKSAGQLKWSCQKKNPLINCHIPLLNCPALACNKLKKKTRIRLYLQSLQTPPQLRLKFVLPNITDHLTLHAHKDEHRNFTLFGIRKCVFQTKLLSSPCKML